MEVPSPFITCEQIQVQLQSGQDEHDKLTYETTRRERYLTVAAPPKSLHYVRREAHSRDPLERDIFLF